MDTQYTRKKYEEMTAGWGHATPDYTARVARVVGAKALGLTHHDPASSDVLVDEIVETARTILAADGIVIPVFGCRDYTVVEVGNVGSQP
jgi:ribonuclease BN (tRNA processing enzyme)